MTAESLTAVVAVLFVGVCICVTPALTRPTLPFGVRVPPQHTGAAVIQRERRAYYWRAAVVVLCCVAAALALTGTGSARLTAIVLPAELAADLGCFWVARERITAVKHTEGWYEGLRPAVTADTSWRTDLSALRNWQVYRLSGLGAVLPVLPGLAGLVILVAVAVRTGQGGSRLPGPGSRRSPVPQVNRDDDRFWKGGLIYINRDDPAIMVGNRFGVGWTPNLGNPKACLLYGCILAAIVALAVVRVVAGA